MFDNKLEKARSKFAADYSLTFDDSFIEMHFVAKCIAPEKLIASLPYFKEISTAVGIAARSKRIRASNCFLALPNFGFDRKFSDRQPYACRLAPKINRRALLKFIGSFEVQQTAELSHMAIPMKQKRILLLKDDYLQDNFVVFGIERTGSSLTIYNGRSRSKLRNKTRVFESPAKANDEMNSETRKKINDGFVIEKKWRRWIKAQ